MLEILILIALGRNIAAKARGKGRSGPAYVFLLLGLWFGGEILGAVAAGIVSLAVEGGEEPNMLVMWLAGMGCAVVGAVIAFGIVHALPPVDTEPEGEYEYE